LRACAEAALELSKRRAEVDLSKIENEQLKKQITVLNSKVDTALKLADNERLSVVKAEALIVTLKELNISYEKSVQEYKKELENKNKEIAKLKKGRFKWFFGGVAVGLVVVVGLVGLTNK